MGKVAPLLGDTVMAGLASPLVLLGLKEKKIRSIGSQGLLLNLKLVTKSFWA